MPERLTVLLDQNVPREIVPWLRGLRPSWHIYHATEVGLAEKPDPEVFAWAQAHEAIIVTFDEDFADQRSFPVGDHHGVVRLHIWPTTTEEVQDAMARLLAEVPDAELSGALVIIERGRIRVRAPRPGRP